MKTLQNLKSKKGFTLVELLVVIAILAVLAVAVVVVLNPAELLKQARDSTRISDLAAINSAIALYFADVAPSSMTQAVRCTSGVTFPGTSVTACTASTSTVVTSAGWVAVDFTAVSSGSPLARLPLDPINTGSLYYAAKVSSTVGAYEINANMESIKYSSTTASEVVSATKDGGNVAGWYEVGSSLAQTW
jgi:prepilin-type N-terminal cleavage/methylation domain-containing protein